MISYGTILWYQHFGLSWKAPGFNRKDLSSILGGGIALTAHLFNHYVSQRCAWVWNFLFFRSSHLEVFLRKGVLKICSKFTGEHLCRSVISVKLLSNFIEIAFWHRCSPVNLLRIFRTPFPTNTSEWLVLIFGWAASIWQWFILSSVARAWAPPFVHLMMFW